MCSSKIRKFESLTPISICDILYFCNTDNHSRAHNYEGNADELINSVKAKSVKCAKQSYDLQS